MCVCACVRARMYETDPSLSPLIDGFEQCCTVYCSFPLRASSSLCFLCAVFEVDLSHC